MIEFKKLQKKMLSEKEKQNLSFSDIAKFCNFSKQTIENIYKIAKCLNLFVSFKNPTFEKIKESKETNKKISQIFNVSEKIVFTIKNKKGKQLLYSTVYFL